MGFGSWIRRSGFWICDRIFFRGEVWNNYSETRDAFYSGTDNDAVNRKLEKLLEHASSTTKFYANYKGIKELSKYPIVNKIDYKEQSDKFISLMYRNDPKCYWEATSGSTGTPLEILYDKHKMRKRYGTSIFLNKLADYQIGDKQLYLRIWVNRIKKSFLGKKMMNLIPWDTTNLDKEHLEQICHTISKKHIESIVGYASSITTLSSFIKDNNIDCSGFKVKSITPVSEMMSPHIRKQLEDQFRCTVSSIYGAEEFGTIGVQLKGSDEYYIDTTGVYIEVLKMNENIPAENGELGRLVITDLHNYAFPIIRYENGDVVMCKTIYEQNGRYRKYFTQIYGRKIDLIYGTDGTPRSPYLIVNKMWGMRDITQWKFIQKGEKNYCFLINGKKENVDETYICDLIKDDLGKDAEISFEYVDEIPVLRSGKRRFIENQYRKD